MMNKNPLDFINLPAIDVPTDISEIKVVLHQSGRLVSAPMVTAQVGIEPPKRTVHTSSTTHTFTAGCTAAFVQVWGAGGGGRAIDGTGATRSAPGGGAGEYTEKLISNPPSSSTITIGSGGATGNSGGNSSYADGTNTVTANGGTSGATVTSAALTTPSAGGTGGGGGDLSIPGGPGEATFATALNRSGDGGLPPLGVGSPGQGQLNSTTAGQLGAAGYGAGGAGANSGGSAGARSGGTGAPGLVIITEYFL